MKRGAIILWMGLVFLCGGVLGALGQRLYTVSSVRANVSGQRNPEEFRKRFVASLKSRLHASDDQVSKITAIMDQTRERFRETRDSIEPSMKRIREQQQEQIRALLTPEQATEWDKWRQERAEKRKQRGDRPPDAPPGQ